MAKRQALGRGLSALLENAANAPEPKPVEKGSIGNVAGSIAMLRISQIEANPFQPRTKFNEEALQELAHSISELGIIQPITVRKIGANKFQLISGERRFRASQIAELEEVPAYIRSANDQEMLEMALVENIQRENLDAIEIAISYQRLLEECELTQDELSDRVGKNRATVSNYLRLLKLPADIQLSIIEKKLSMGHARALITLDDTKKQLQIMKQVIDQDLSVRATEALVRDARENTKSAKKATASKSLSFEHQKVRADLRLKFGRSVELRAKDDGSGKIEINFKDEDDLKRLLESLDL
ncbi:ParB/RepB/Spo0J family partition protein [Sanyastnella coralliicola]|uniref:ParB/RepB/Spo0J family partition protein n=1 Tax=Sanyastnella coralliicola TaxID=3069118 RepID=UPI0027BA6BF4|nr:ParB/RepB/Spo0J family partition protein [Longitalea sp. SCSIO 12813]